MLSPSTRRVAAALMLTATLAPAASAAGIRLRVDEDVAGTHPIASLRDRLSLEETATLRLLDNSNGRFHIDDDGWLVLSETAHLDFESEPVHEFVVEVLTRRAADPLRDRFASQATSAGLDRAEIDALHTRRRLVPVTVLVNDRPDRPRLAPGLFRLTETASSAAEGVCGRAVAADEDADDRLHFELLDGRDWFRMDPATGILFYRTQARLPAVSTANLGIAVTDSAGLTDRRHYTIPLLPLRLAATRLASTAPAAEPSLDTTPDVEAEQRLPVVATSPVSTVTPVAPVEVEPAAASDVPVNADPERESRATVAAATAALPSEGGVPAGSAVDPSVHVSSARASSWIEVFGWFVWSFVAVGVVIIISSGMRAAGANRIRRPIIDQPTDRLDAMDPPLGDSPPDVAPRVPTPEPFRAPQEIEDVLTRLSESFGNHGTRSSTGTEPTPQQAGSDSGALRVDDLMTHVLSSAGLIVDSDAEGNVMTQTIAEPSSTSVSRARDVLDAGTHLQPEQEATRQLTSSHPRRRRTDDLLANERDSLEEFRLISQRFHRAEINRHHRERMREQWMSIGVAALACLTTGSVCVITRCFGETSLPVGLALIAVSIALLMRRSLYPPTPRRRSTDLPK